MRIGIKILRQDSLAFDGYQGLMISNTLYKIYPCIASSFSITSLSSQTVAKLFESFPVLPCLNEKIKLCSFLKC